ncbi:MAG: 3-phosphoshikimate 1-carboxyvinyltransferase, partial [Oscillospiraceae bacterium]|nr:3-phosphoshikimate 1-carboxyvinyltransferase [Oscillospiraceae bacterium]
MNEEVLCKAGIRLEKEKQTYLIPGGQRFALPDRVTVEGDWSNAAFFLCMGALSDDGVRVEGLNPNSAQGDRAILTILRGFGAIVEEQSGAVHVRRGELRPHVIDAAATPDLVPTLSALAAAVPGETRIENAARLRLKESDRLRTTTAMLTALGASVQELPDGLVIRGGGLHGGVVDAANDHRIAMAAAVAACAAAGDVTVLGAECIEKSYPSFWTDLAQMTAL